MKKLFSIFVLIVLLATFTGCGIQQSYEIENASLQTDVQTSSDESSYNFVWESSQPINAEEYSTDETFSTSEEVVQSDNETSSNEASNFVDETSQPTSNEVSSTEETNNTSKEVSQPSSNQTSSENSDIDDTLDVLDDLESLLDSLDTPTDDDLIIP